MNNMPYSINRRGFTLVEVLVGLFIAVIASTYAAKTITSTNKVVAAGRETFIATNLAHEGLDLTRAMRDNTWFTATFPPDLENRSDWMSKSGICPPDEDSNSFAIDPDVVRDFIINDGTTVLDPEYSALYINPKKLWTHDVSAEEKPFKRVLEASCAESVPGADPEDPVFVTITSTVSWTGQGGIEKSVSLKEKLYNWWPEKEL
ncbi:MAG: prepilin-type N-terminal cleavage/methylation domain-containing protein [bacterium]|nr:prepilin-type N-terminal cleavage/methylation domain-containing protein [bacterium]